MWSLFIQGLIETDVSTLPKYDMESSSGAGGPRARGPRGPGVGARGAGSECLYMDKIFTAWGRGSRRRGPWVRGARGPGGPGAGGRGADAGEEQVEERQV